MLIDISSLNKAFIIIIIIIIIIIVITCPSMMSIPSTQKCQILAIILKIYWSTQLFPVLVLVQLTNDSKMTHQTTQVGANVSK